MPVPLLILEDIHASYVKKETLRGVSLELCPGEVVALVGGNGSGKSTTLKVISGLLPPTSGRIIFRGQDITRTTPQQRQRMGIGYLLQGGRVFPNLTVAENLRIAHAHVRDEIHEHASPAPLGAVFSALAGRRDIPAGRLSGGLRQMLAIEMVLSQRPVLALLDEPSSALAEKLAASFLLEFSSETLRAGHAALLVEQNTAVVAELGVRSLQLSDGTLSANLRQTFL